MHDQPIDDSTGAPAIEVRPRAAPAIECAPLPMVEGPDHIVCFANAAFCRLLQKNRGEIIGRPFEGLVRNGENCVRLLDKVYQTGECESHVEEDHSEMNPAYWLYAMWPSLGDSELPERVVIQLTKAAHFHQNVTAINAELLVAGVRQHELREAAEKANARSQSEIAERMLSEIALRRANVRLSEATDAAERANQFKDGFLAMLSHELRTPLTPALIAAASLREDVRLPSDVRAQAGMIERNIALEARLIDDLLDLTKVSHGKLLLRPEASDLHALIELAIDVLRHEATDKGIVIDQALNARHRVFLVDPGRFQQVVWNLLRNAIKFSRNGSRVSVRTLGLTSPDAKTWIRMEVSDTGLGIDPTELDRIFLPFEQGDAAGDHRFGGVGLGLAIARAVVVAHGGRITASSAGRNRGATFAVELPGAIEPPRVTAKGGPRVSIGFTPPPRPSVRALRLLLVEDHANTLEAVTYLLQRDGHHVVAAATAAAALAAAAVETFDYVISDIGLPDRSGIELMRELRSTYRLRGVALTGYGMEDDLIRARDAGFTHHLVKPVSVAELRRVIASLPDPSAAAQ
jgi:signal transduction histidine kinase